MSNTNLDLHAVCFIDTSRGWAVGYRGIVLRTSNGGWGPLMSLPENPQHVPLAWALHQNYPNPFNPGTTITYELPEYSMVRLGVYDVLGREVAVLVNERRDAGAHEVKFDGSNMASGSYLYRMQVRPLNDAIGRGSRSGVGDVVHTRKFLLIR